MFSFVDVKAELGLSEVSDVSDIELSGDELSKPAGKPPAAAPTVIVSKPAVGHNPPLSARVSVLD